MIIVGDDVLGVPQNDDENRAMVCPPNDDEKREDDILPYG